MNRIHNNKVSQHLEFSNFVTSETGYSTITANLHSDGLSVQRSLKLFPFFILSFKLWSSTFPCSVRCVHEGLRLLEWSLLTNITHMT